MTTRRHSRRQASVDYPRHAPLSIQQDTQPQTLVPQISAYGSNTEFGPPSDQPSTSQNQVKARTVDELNLSVLQRYNPSITAILSAAPYAVIYTFSPSPESAGWVKSGVEGSLFICQLRAGELGESRFNAVVLNRRGLENFEAELKEDETGGVEVTDDYIIITSNVSGQPTAWGIWIFSQGPGSSTAMTRDVIARFVKERAVQAGQSRKAAREAQQQGNATDYPRYQNDHQFTYPMSKQLSLQDMFGEQRKEDDEWTVKVHSPDGRTDPSLSMPASTQAQQGHQTNFAQARPQEQGQPESLVRNLFTKAGLSR